jgi:hypothetical protein
VTSRVAVGPWHGDEALTADGVIIAITAAVNISTIPIPTDSVTRIAGLRASARLFCFFIIEFPFLVVAFFLNPRFEKSFRAVHWCTVRNPARGYAESWESLKC